MFALHVPGLSSIPCTIYGSLSTWGVIPELRVRRYPLQGILEDMHFKVCPPKNNNKKKVFGSPSKSSCSKSPRVLNDIQVSDSYGISKSQSLLSLPWNLCFCLVTHAEKCILWPCWNSSWCVWASFLIIVSLFQKENFLRQVKFLSRSKMQKNREFWTHAGS